jgi:hypothetical protein
VPIGFFNVDPEYALFCDHPDHMGEMFFTLDRRFLAVELIGTIDGARVHFLCPGCGVFRTIKIVELDTLELLLGIGDSIATLIGEKIAMVAPKCTLEDWQERILAKSPRAA